MALVLKDRVKGWTDSYGEDNFVIFATTNGYQSFSVIGNGNQTYYTVFDPTNYDWEVGIGTYTAATTTLSRDTILSSSNNNLIVSFLPGTKELFVGYPAEKAVTLDTPQTLTDKTLVNATVTSGTVNNTTIGATTPASGAFTTLVASGASLTSVNAGVALLTSATVTTLNATGASIASANIGNLQFTAASIASINAGVAVITNLTATGASIASANVGTAVITTGTVTNLTSTSASVASINAAVALITTGTVTALTATGASVASANVGTAVVTGLTVTNVSIASLNAGTATVTTGNLTFSSTAQRITGDMSNATIANRLIVQTSTTNGNTLFSVMPNGTGTAALVRAFNSSTPAQFVDIRIDGTEAQLRSSYEGTSTFLPLTFYTGGSERMRLDTSGNLGIGTSTASFRVTNNFDAPAAWGNNANNFIEMWQNSGTNALGVAMGDDSLVSLTTNNGYSLLFATSGTERMRIDSSGNVGIGGTPNAFAKLHILGTYPTSSNTTVVNWITGTIPSGTTSIYYSTLSQPSTQAASFTLGTLVHFLSAQGTIGAGSAITTQYGFYADGNMTGATNNYGFYSNIASGSNRWNFYAAGTAANYFAGTVQNGSTISVGAATPAASGAGVTFPATQSASSDANTLDDYEEGTWTPTLKNASSSSTFTSNTGRYTKIGRLVYCSFVNDSGNTGTAGSDITLSGLPFAYGGTSNVPTLVAFTANGLPAAVNCYLSRTINGSTSFVVRDAAGNSLTNQLTFAAGTIIYEV